MSSAREIAERISRLRLVLVEPLGPVYGFDVDGAEAIIKSEMAEAQRLAAAVEKVLAALADCEARCDQAWEPHDVINAVQAALKTE